MNTLPRKTARQVRHQAKDKRSTDPLDRVIFERNLRIRHLLLDKEMDLLLLVLTNGAILKSRLSDFPKLKKATAKQLDDWRLIGGGVGIEWGGLDEDLSLKGFVKSAYVNRALRILEGREEGLFA